jgi:hypothetical protein
MVQQTSVQRAVARQPEANKYNELASGSRDSRSPLRQLVANVTPNSGSTSTPDNFSSYSHGARQSIDG